MSFPQAIIPKPVVIDTAVLDYDEEQVGFKQLAGIEKEFYYWVNYSRKDTKRFFDSVIVPISKIYPQLKGENFSSLRTDLYSSPPLKLLSLNTALISMARAHSKDITSHDASPSHYSTNGDSFTDRFKSFGLKQCGGENISYGAGEPIFLVVLLYLDIAIPDLGHRKALLNLNFRETGVGASTYKNGNLFLVEDFSCSQN